MRSVLLCILNDCLGCRGKPWLASVSSQNQQHACPQEPVRDAEISPRSQQEPRGHLRGCRARTEETLEAVPSALQAGHRGLCPPQEEQKAQESFRCGLDRLPCN